MNPGEELLLSLKRSQLRWFGQDEETPGQSPDTMQRFYLSLVWEAPRGGGGSSWLEETLLSQQPKVDNGIKRCI